MIMYIRNIDNKVVMMIKINTLDKQDLKEYKMKIKIKR